MLEYAFNAFVTLLVVIDPLGLAPIYAALTRGYSDKRKRDSAIRGTSWALASCYCSRSPVGCC